MKIHNTFVLIFKSDYNLFMLCFGKICKGSFYYVLFIYKLYCALLNKRKQQNFIKLVRSKSCRMCPLNRDSHVVKLLNYCLTFCHEIITALPMFTSKNANYFNNYMTLRFTCRLLCKLYNYCDKTAIGCSRFTPSPGFVSPFALIMTSLNCFGFHGYRS